jgi:hypothetical protein
MAAASWTCSAQGPAVTQPGDVWHIGPHRLICGDATLADTYQRLLGTAGADGLHRPPL